MSSLRHIENRYIRIARSIKIAADARVVSSYYDTHTCGIWCTVDLWGYKHFDFIDVWLCAMTHHGISRRMFCLESPYAKHWRYLLKKSSCILPFLRQHGVWTWAYPVAVGAQSERCAGPLEWLGRVLALLDALRVRCACAAVVLGVGLWKHIAMGIIVHHQWIRLFNWNEASSFKINTPAN